MWLVQSGVRLDVAYAIAFIAQTFIHGIYTFLFIIALPVMTKRKRLWADRGMFSAWVFLIGSILMYLVSTFHMALAVYRLLQSSILGVDPLGTVHYLQNPKHWEFLCNIILLCIMTWLGDSLVIYRCYFVWNNNIWLVATPITLLLTSIGINTFVLFWIRHPLAADPRIGLKVFRTVYPLAFIQNSITTGLIILKIWWQYRISLASGVVDQGSALTLIRVVRIIIESAMIYTSQLLIIIILFFLNDNFQYVVQAAIGPSIGITFLLIALRIHSARKGDATIRTNLGFRNTMPVWLDGDGGHSDEESEGAPERNSVQLVDVGSSLTRYPSQ